MSVLRRLLVALLALMVAAGAPGPAAEAAPQCRGRDLLAEMKESAVERHAEIMAAAEREANGQAILWRIERTGAPPSWLFGTVHLTDDRVHALTRAVRGALESSKVLALEVEELSAETLTRAMLENSRLLVMPEGRRLDQLLTPQELRKTQGRAAAAPVPGDQQRSLRPWFLAMMLALPDCEHARQAGGRRALDSALRERALARGLRVIGLETVSEQLAALAGMPLSAEVAWLKSSLALYDRLEDVTETIVRLYLDRRMGAVWPLSQALSGQAALAPEDLESFKQALLYRRNDVMVERMAPVLAAGGAFVAVGARHLPGEKGLVTLLRRAGYTVVPVE